jgi:hypothetical protein
MNQSTIKLFAFFLLSIASWSALAQMSPSKNWDIPKIKGMRQETYRVYIGSPYLTESFCRGQIEFITGEISDSIDMRYSSFKDEIIYYNDKIGAQIKVDKATIAGFKFTDNLGLVRNFRKQEFDNNQKEQRYFEIISPGETSLLCFRKVTLSQVSSYIGESGQLKNMEYFLNYTYYFYSASKGYTSVRLNKASFLSKFSKESEKPLRKLLRKNRISVLNNEPDLVRAWELAKENGFKVMF